MRKLELLSSAFILGGTSDNRLKGCVIKNLFYFNFLFPFKGFGKEDRSLRIEQKIKTLDQRLSNNEMRLTRLEANVEAINKRTYRHACCVWGTMWGVRRTFTLG
jgi:hypothetical protein